MSAVWDLDISPNEKLVLLAYADCANDKGVAWPSKSEISRKCRLHPDTIKRTGRSLREKGLIEVLEAGRGDGKGSGKAPVICVRVGGHIVPPQETVRGDALLVEGGRPAALRGDGSSPPSIKEPSSGTVSSSSPPEKPALPNGSARTNGKAGSSGDRKARNGIEAPGNPAPPAIPPTEMNRLELLAAGRGAIAARFMPDVRELRLGGVKEFSEAREIRLLEQMLQKFHEPVDITRSIRGLVLLRSLGAVEWLQKDVPGTMRCLYHTKSGAKYMFQVAIDYYLKHQEKSNGGRGRKNTKKGSSRPVPVEIQLTVGGGEGSAGGARP